MIETPSNFQHQDTKDKLEISRHIVKPTSYCGRGIHLFRWVFIAFPYCYVPNDDEGNSASNMFTGLTTLAAVASVVTTSNDQPESQGESQHNANPPSAAADTLDISQKPTMICHSRITISRNLLSIRRESLPLERRPLTNYYQSKNH